MKKIIAILAVIALIAAAGFGITLWNTKKAADNAVSAYNEAAQEYNEKIAPYNAAAAGIAEANAGLQEVLDNANASVSLGKDAYDRDTLEDLEIAVKEAESAFAEIPVQIDPFPGMEPSNSFNRTELEVVRLEADAASAAVREALEKVPEIPEVPDYTKQIESVKAADKAYADSVQKLANVTAPSAAFVQKRLTGIDTVLQAEAVSEGNDPNGLLGKKGGYQGCVYFLDSRIDLELLPEEVLTVAGNESEDESESEGGSGSDNETDSGNESDVSDTENADESSAAEEAAAETDAETTAASETDDEGSADTGKTTADEAAAVDISSTGMTAAAEIAATDISAAEETTDPEAAGTASTETAAETAATEATAAEAAAAEPEQRYNVVAAGTAGGGAVEIFATEQEAEARNQYLSFFAGSVMDPGTHAIEGTCVIRASRYLEDTQQHELIETVREALLKVE